MSRLIARLEEISAADRPRRILLDGATGTELIARGVAAGEAPDLWNLTHPDDVAAVHESYYDAGSHIVQTNTFGASPVRLAESGIEGKCRDINLKAVEIILSVRPEGCFAAGNIGPSGKMLEPVGNAVEEELYESFAIQASILAEGGVDLVTVETMSDVREAVLAVKAGVEAGLPVFAAMTFRETRRGYRTIMGDEASKCMELLEDAGAAAAGANCTLTSSEMTGLAEVLCRSTSLPVIFKPNAGKPELVGDKVSYRANAEDFADDIASMAGMGGTVLGGCCGTDPSFIKTMVERLGG